VITLPLALVLSQLICAASLLSQPTVISATTWEVVLVVVAILTRVVAAVDTRSPAIRVRFRTLLLPTSALPTSRAAAITWVPSSTALTKDDRCTDFHPRKLAAAQR
jgi:hypothetical protein